MALFSIITIHYNDKSGLQKTIDNILSQSCQDYEWIVVDGNSSDGSKEILEENKGRFTWWHSEQDKGIYDAMNKGLDHAKGKYVVFMNAGDFFANEDTLQNIKAFLDNQDRKPDFLYGDAYEGETAEVQQYKKARSHNKIWYSLFTHHQAMFYRRSVIGDDRHDLTYKISGDYHFTLRHLQKCQNIAYLPKPLCFFTLGGVSQTSATRGRKENFLARQDVLNMPYVMNLSTVFLNWLSFVFQSTIPPLYQLIRFRSVSS